MSSHEDSVLMKFSITVRILAAMAVAGILSLTAFILLATPSSPATTREDRTQGGLLLTPNRDRMAVCLQPTAGAAIDTESAKARVLSALGELRAGWQWLPAGLGATPAEVDVSCPSEPYHLREDFRDKAKGGDPQIQGVSTASKYRVFLFIAPQAEIDRAFPVGTHRRVPQEILLLRRDQGAEVTTALYLSPAELSDHAFLKEWLAKAIGI